MQERNRKPVSIAAAFTAGDVTGEFNHVYWTAAWMAALPIHFPGQLAAANAIATVFFALCGLPELSCITLVGFVLSAAQLLTFRNESPMRPQTDVRTSLTILQHNVLYSTPTVDRFMALVRAKQPDIIALQEVTPEWEDAARQGGLFEIYPHYSSSFSHYWNVSCKVAFLSKEPFDDVRIECSDANDSSIIASRTCGGTTVKFVVAHPRAPISPYYFFLQIRQFKFLQEILGADKSLVVLGDMNSTPFLPTFRQFMAALNLHDSRLDCNKNPLQPTWPVPIQRIGLPLDYCLISSNICAEEFELCDATGSDHLPVLVKLRIHG